VLKPGARLGPYEILRSVGAGGMGEVYRARDTRLGREVAIKVLPPEFAGDPDRLRRFEREARAVAALSHPNILAIFDVGVRTGLAPAREGAGPSPTGEEAVPIPYLVTELLEGESLRERLKQGALPARKAIEVAVQIAEGLAAAHAKGIVHRDLKPENVFVTKDGHVKILDFGIAKLAPPRNAEEVARATTVLEATEIGTMLGTIGYMSPEQVRGQAVDQRSDIFSFGCVLYEMVTGRQPFARDTAAETMTAILKEEPQDPSNLTISVPPALSHLMTHCLEKDANQRAHSAHDLVFELRTFLAEAGGGPARPRETTWRRNRVAAAALGGAVVVIAAGLLAVKLRAPASRAAAAAAPRIVVLPFENLGAPEDAYFATGMTEEITSRLANVHGLGVISRTSANQYEHTHKSLKQIGAELGVDYVLEGSVRWEHGAGRDSRVRITPQLIRVADDTHVWADRYDRVIADIFAVQSEVAEDAVKAMGFTLLPRDETALKEISTDDLDAYDLYLRGQELYNGGEDRRHLEGALQMYQAAVDRDPHFAQALAGLASSHVFMYWLHLDRSPDRLVKAKDAAERAVELRPDLAATHIALGYYFLQGLLDFPRALSEFSAALKIQPNSNDALTALAYVVRRQGHWADSAEQLSNALEFDPRDADLLFNFGEGCVLTRRYADADRAWGLAIVLSPQWGEPYGRKAWLQVQWHGDVGKGQAVLDEAGRIAGLTDDYGYLAEVAMRVALARRDYQAALRQLESETRLAIDIQWHYSPTPLLRGEIQMLAGQHDLARRSFEIARLELEQEVTQTPDDNRFHSSLGIAYAGLGRTAEAVREAKLGRDLMPASRDAWRTLYRLQDMALVFTMVGQRTEAIAALDDLLGRSGEWTPNVLRLDPRWDPLRSDPRFQALLTKYEVKE
jgi:TolB-like protein/Flp pilus assembly protein TadD